MCSGIKMSQATIIALDACAFLATHEGVQSTPTIAEGIGASAAHLAKVMQRLSRSGVLETTRGQAGGFQLADAADEVTVLRVYQDMEGPLCVGGLAETALGDHLERVMAHIASDLESVTIADLAARR